MTLADISPAPHVAGWTPASDAPAWNELHADSGAIRPHWQELTASIDALGRDEFNLRLDNGRRILREHGVSCFHTGPDGDRDVPWELDFLPFVLAADEWRELSAGLVQRARLLNLVLGDLHGVHRLVRDGFIPAPLVFANPAYLRACQAIRIPGGNYLPFYAADLARGPDGRWWVIADRTQAPAGLGFALENRGVMARVLPEALQRVGPRSLSDSIRVGRDAVRRLAPAGVENPAVALLTPGQRNEAYFEHAYLSRLLGYTLVEGGDLTVREGRVFLKTLEGLHPVDVILRRVSDAFCDPLALRGESLIGVPGLVEATRSGAVAVANALGSGLVESPAFLPFLSALGPYLLGEELALPTVATWWCGQPRERRYVEQHLDELCLRPALSTSHPFAEPCSLTTEAKEAWIARLRERPHEFVGQEQVLLSQAPLANGDSGSLVLRCFVLFDGENYLPVPGGIARIVHREALGTTPLSLIGPTKDVWVLPEAESSEGLPHSVGSPAPVSERQASDLPSRSAENLFWLARYTERLEQLVRICRSAAGSLVGESAEGRAAAFAELLARLHLADAPPEDGSVSEFLQDRVLDLLFDDGLQAGVRGLLRRIHTASFAVRDRLSGDTWRLLNRLGTDAGTRPEHLPLVGAGATLNALVLDLAAFSGMEMENMTRGHGWVFLDLGRRIERGLGITRLLDAAVRCESGRELLLEPLLEISDSVITYRRRYFAEPRLASVLDLLLLDVANPRAFAFQLATLERHAAGLPAGPNPGGVAEVRQRLARLTERLDRLGPDPFEPAVDPAFEAHRVADLGLELAAVSDMLTQVYFSQVLPRVS